MAKEKAPAFQWYARDFLADENVMQMGVAERGVYITLLSVCWLEKSIPADLAAMARMLPRMTARELGKHWALVGRCFSAHPTDPGRLVHRRLDEERRHQAERREKAAANGRQGGRPPKRPQSDDKPDEKRPVSEHEPDAIQTESTATATATASATATSGSASLRSALDAREDPQRPLGEDEFPGLAHAEDHPEATRFAAWFVAEGVRSGALPAHEGFDVLAYARRHKAAAEALVATQPIDVLHAQSGRLFAKALSKGPDRQRVVTIEILRDHWTWFDDGVDASHASPNRSGGVADRYSRPRATGPVGVRTARLAAIGGYDPDDLDAVVNRPRLAAERVSTDPGEDDLDVVMVRRRPTQEHVSVEGRELVALDAVTRRDPMTGRLLSELAREAAGEDDLDAVLCRPRLAPEAQAGADAA